MKHLAEFQEAMRECSNVDYRATMKDAADHCFLWLGIFHENPTTENLRNLVGVWSNATRLYKNIPPEGAPAPLSGDAEPARLAA